LMLDRAECRLWACGHISLFFLFLFREQLMSLPSWGRCAPTGVPDMQGCMVRVEGGDGMLPYSSPGPPLTFSMWLPPLHTQL
jgi:hypothetical protein